MTKRILIVEDSPTQAQRLRLVLSSAGYEVEVVANGSEGRDSSKQRQPV